MAFFRIPKDKKLVVFGEEINPETRHWDVKVPSPIHRPLRHIPILESKETKERRTAMLPKVIAAPKIAEDAVNDPAYIQEILGDKKSSWEEL